MSELRRGGIHLAAGTVVSRVLGFLRAASLAAVVGAVASEAADAFAIANQLPNNVFWLVSSGVFSAVLVPQLVRSTRDEDGGRAYLNKLLTVGVVILTAVTIAALALAPWLVGIYTREWSAEQLDLAVAFAVWCLPQIFFFGLFSLFGEALNARRKFGPAAWAPIVNNVFALAGLGLFAIAFGVFPEATGSVRDWTPTMVAVLAGTTTVGVVSQAIVVVVALRRAGVRVRLDFRWRGVELGRTSRIAGWTFGLVLIGQLLGIVQAQVAGLATGAGASVFAGSTAWLLFMLPYSVIAVSIGTVYFTRFSEHGADGNVGELGADVAATSRVLLVAMVGATAAMLLAAVPISRFFTDTTEAAAALALLLVAYVIALVPFALLYLIQRAFYALNDARSPFMYTCVQGVVLLTGTVVLPLFVPVAYLAASVALVQSIATSIQAVVAAVLLRRAIGPLGGRAWLVVFGRSAIAAAVSGLLCLPVWWLLVGPELNGWATGARVEGLIGAAVLALLCILVYVASLVALRDPVTRGIYRDFLARRRRP